MFKIKNLRNPSVWKTDDSFSLKTFEIDNLVSFGIDKTKDSLIVIY